MLTINIEDSSLKITSVKGNRVVFAGEVPMEIGWVRSGGALEGARVGRLISTLLAQNGIKEKECVACVSGIQSIYRVAYVPRLDPALLAEAAKQELARAIPVPLDSLYTFWKDVRMSDMETALCLVGLPFDNVNSVMEALKSAGLRVKYLELKPLAVSRVIDEKTAIVLNVNPAGFDLTIINDGLPELIRSLPFPASMAGEDDKAAMVRDELEKTIGFYNSGHASRPLNGRTQCVLSGSLREKLSAMLGYPCKPPPSLLAYPAGQDENNFTANTGLALRSAGRPNGGVDINVMPQAAAAGKRGGSASAFTLLPLVAPLVVLVVCAAALFGMWYINGTAEVETAKLQLQMNEKATLLSDTQKLYGEKTAQDEKELADKKKDVDTLKAPVDYLAERRELVNRDIAEMIAPLPGSVYLTNITVSSGSIVLTGSAPSEEILLNYARDLRAKGIYKLVMITSVDKSSFIEVFFNITLTTN
jgi:Tfp pilus assembly protein PilN